MLRNINQLTQQYKTNVKPGKTPSAAFLLHTARGDGRQFLLTSTLSNLTCSLREVDPPRAMLSMLDCYCNAALRHEAQWDLVCASPKMKSGVTLTEFDSYCSQKCATWKDLTFNP